MTCVGLDDLAIPFSVRDELIRISAARRCGLSELHLRAFGRSSADFSGERVYFSHSPTVTELSDSLKRLCGGALYMYRDSIKSGYITVEGGVRVGICADARYESGRLVGLGEPLALIYRIPESNIVNADELYSAWQKTERGMLIYSPPRVGKTTALRSLTFRIGGGKNPLNVAVIDERHEFCASDFKECAVDIFSGYKKADGMEIALRTSSADVIAIDEIGGKDEALRMLDFLNSGVRVIATAHAGSEAEALKRSSLRPFFEHGIFDTLAGLYMPNLGLNGGERVVKITRLDA